MGAHTAILASVVCGTLLLYAYSLARYGDVYFTVDSYLCYVHAHSWYFDGDADYENNMVDAPGFGAADIYVRRHSANGRVVHFWPCGWSIVALPFVAIADGVTATHNAVFNGALPRDGFSVYYRTIVPLGHVLLGIAGLLAAYSLAARYVARNIAAMATAVVWLGTNVGYFVGVEPTMTHAGSMSFVAMMVLVVDSIGRRGWTWGRAVALGLSCGMMLALRHQNIVWIAVPAIILAPSLMSDLVTGRKVESQARARGLAWKRIGLLGVAVALACVCMVPQILTNLAIEGKLVGEVATHLPHWLSPKFAMELLGSRSGLLIIYPLAPLCVMGVMLGIVQRRRRALFGALIVAFSLLVYINACWVFGAVAHPRRYACGAAMFVLGLAVLFEWARNARWRSALVGVLVAVFCVRNVALELLVDRQWIARSVLNSGPPFELHSGAGEQATFIVCDALARLIAGDVPG